jgi:FG-GAP-like repeat
MRKIITLFLLYCALSFYPQGNDAQPRWPMFRKHVLDSGANESAAVADINKDGRLDIFAGENWYEAPQWTKHRIREIPFISGYIDDLSNFALDVNDDGYPDVIASSWFSKKMSWYQNPGKSSSDSLWKEHPIESGFNYELILLVDINGDGKAEEILPNYGSSGEVVWFERARPFTKGDWVRHVAGTVPDVKGLHGIGAGDLNGDRRPDILTSYGWFEAPAWKYHPAFRLLPPRGQCSPLYVDDVNRDGKNDLIYGAGHHYGLFWLESRNGSWQEHLIDDSWSQAHALTLADMDGDGKLDIVTGKRYLAHDTDPGAYEPLGLYWYRSTPGSTYVKHVIDFGSKAGGGMQIPVLDLDGDGDLDIVAPGKSGLFLFEQVDLERQKGPPQKREDSKKR